MWATAVRMPPVKPINQKFPIIIKSNSEQSVPSIQWRSQKFSLGGAIAQFWLKSLINIKHFKNNC